MLASENVFAFGYGFFLIGKELGVQKRELRKVISRYYFLSSLTARYSGSAESTVETDLLSLRNIKTPEDFISAIEEIISTEVTEDLWKIRIPNSKFCFIFFSFLILSATVSAMSSCVV